LLRTWERRLAVHTMIPISKKTKENACTQVSMSNLVEFLGPRGGGLYPFQLTNLHDPQPQWIGWIEFGRIFTTQKPTLLEHIISKRAVDKQRTCLF
jgi:hypothetical protein